LEEFKMSTKILLINAVVLAIITIAMSFFVDDVMPIIYVSGGLNLLNIIAFVAINKNEDGKK